MANVRYLTIRRTPEGEEKRSHFGCLYCLCTLRCRGFFGFLIVRRKET